MPRSAIPVLIALVFSIVRILPAAEPPNFLIFLVDDMGWIDPECYGSTFHETPHINQLAEEGMRFTDAYAACPVCSPTRASIVTGKYPARLNLTDFIPGHWRPYEKLVVPEMNMNLPLEEQTFAELLKAKGYVSGSFGKWHLGGASHFPGQQGFDEFTVTSGRHFAPKFQTNPPEDVPDDTYLADYLTGKAEDFLERHKDDRFVLYLPHYAVHIPLEAEEKLIEKYRKKGEQPEYRRKVRITITFGEPTKEKSAKDRRWWVEMHNAVVPSESNKLKIEGMTTQRVSGDTLIQDVAVGGSPSLTELNTYAEHVKASLMKSFGNAKRIDCRISPVNNPTYAAMVEHIDRSLGRIMRKLDELKLSENTVLIFFSDNGGLYQRFDKQGEPVMNNLPLRDEKGSLYEGGIREPLIIRWPGKIAAGAVCHTPVSSVDFVPTMLELAGVEHPPGGLDGMSLVPLLTGEGKLDREAIFWHYPHYHHTTPAGAIRAGDWKLIEYFDDSHVELYNLREDLGETEDLAVKNPEKAAELRRQLAAWRESVGARMPTENPDYDPARIDEWKRRPRP